jgi:hypothetical protein
MPRAGKPGSPTEPGIPGPPENQTAYATYTPPEVADPKLSIREKFTVLGTLLAILPVLRGMLEEQKEANRLRKLYFKVRGVTSADLLTPQERLTRMKAAEAAGDQFEIEQPTSAFYAEYERRLAAAKERGVDIREGEDLDEAERQESGG